MKEEKMITIYYKNKEHKVNLITEFLVEYVQQIFKIKIGNHFITLSRRVKLHDYIQHDPEFNFNYWENKFTGDVYELNHETMTLGLIFKAGI